MINSADSWSPPPNPPTLNDHEVHVWRAALDVSSAQAEGLRQTLSADEAARSDRFYLQRDRERYAVTHAALRDILGRYAGIEPRQLRFDAGPYGKPYLRQDRPSAILNFSLSHSHELALIAVSHGREVGVDIEFIHPEVAELQLAERFFSPAEAAGLRSLPGCVQKTAFFEAWTCKEAYLKATGRGFSLPLDQFVISVNPEEPTSLLETRWDPDEASRWSLARLAPWPGYAAAVAVQGQSWQLRCWQWTV